MSPVALVCGIPSEPPLAMVIAALEAEGLPHLVWNQRRFADLEIEATLTDAGLRGSMTVGSRSVQLEDVVGVYTRCTDLAVLPELERLAPDDPARARCEELHTVLSTFIELTPARVVNRAITMGSNGSKPYQAQLIRKAGFAVPPTLVTNDPADALAFQARHGRVVFKATSGERTIVTELGPEHRAALDRLPRCPTQFQRYVPGRDVRVHVIGHLAFATSIDSSRIDYRYAQEGAQLKPFSLDAELEHRCIALASALGLPFAGIDLRIGDDDVVHCFEVNPSPAYSYYEHGTGQPIARAVARHLFGLDG